MELNTYKSAMCGGVFDYEWTDEEAVAEMNQYYGKDFKKEDCEVVCDDCFQKIHPDNHPPRGWRSS
jgi:hypothetical protein